MRVWRLCSRRHRRFDGEGARLYGGRWNHAGTSIVYTSGSLSLAALELFVHVDTDLAPAGLFVIPADIPEDVPVGTVDIAKLPRNWRSYPAPETLKDITTAWVKGSSTAVLAVPSAVIPSERNYLLNPKHPDFRRIGIQQAIPFEFDPRMWK
ncbi:MAG: RES family NAD+ phosphorylase [Candidatus Binatia bacterium]